MNTSTERPSTLSGAILLLETALKNTDTVSLRDLMEKELTQIKNLVRETPIGESTLGAKFDSAQEQFDQFDGMIRENPWPVICGAALGAFAVGFLASRQTKGMS